MGHFFAYAPADKIEARNYGVARYGMEVKRLFDVMEKHLSGAGSSGGPRSYLVNEEYTIADMVCFAWPYFFRGANGYKSAGKRAADVLSFSEYTHLNAWLDRIEARPAVQRGVKVCTKITPNLRDSCRN